MFQPVYLDVINESYMHNVPKGMIYTAFLMLYIFESMLFSMLNPQLCPQQSELQGLSETNSKKL